MLAGPPADALPVAEEVQLLDLGVVAVGEGDVDEADGFFCVGAGARGRAGDASDGDADRGAGAGANAFGEGAGYFGGDGAVGGDEVGGYVGEGGLQGVGVDDSSAEEVAGAVGYGGEALRDQASGAAFGGGEGEVTEAEHEEDDLFEALTVGGVDVLLHLGFDAAGEFVDAALGFGKGRFGGNEVELDLAGGGQDGGFDVGILLVDGGGAGIDLRLGD